MLKFSDVKTYVEPRLQAKGYSASNPFVDKVDRTMPLIDPGPFTISRLTEKSPGPMLFLVVGNGMGPTTETLYDRPFITVRVLGKQGDYEYAENLAYDVDDILMSAVNGETLGTAHTLYVTRTGAPPQLVTLDKGDRYHYQTTYITEVLR